MAKKSEYTISDLYQGGYSSLNPDYGSVFTGYNTNVTSLGLTTDPRTANILQEISAKLPTGVKHMEVTGVSSEILESIPQQHLKEARRKAKLAGAEISVHAPVVEASGISERGFSESNRTVAERQMALAVERSHELNPEGNIPVTFHSSAVIPQAIPQKGKELEETYVINAETGSPGRIKLMKSTFPGEEKKEIDPKEEISKRNQEEWGENIRVLNYYTNMAERMIDESQLLLKSAEAERLAGKEIAPIEREVEISFRRGGDFLDYSYKQLQNLFEIANRHGSEHEKVLLKQFSESIKPKVNQIKATDDPYENARLRREIIDEGVGVFNKMSPEIFQPLGDFAKKNTTQTFANVAWNAYNKFKDKTPIINIENPPAGGGFSRAKELKEIVEKSREKFVEQAVKSGMNEKEARAAAEKTIGVTWDVGHINMLRKYGYEAKDIIKETEKIAPLVKHIHLSDNFGIEHTELPMGMGNVPVEEMLKKIPNKEAKKIIEASSWYQHFKTTPLKETFEAFGLPMYAFGPPYWNQALGLQQNYYTGLAGQWLPQINYETWGAGFSQLPSEFGGQRQGAQGGRMSGRPME